MNKNISLQKITNKKEILNILYDFDNVFYPNLHDRINDFEKYALKLSDNAEVYIMMIDNIICGLTAYYLNSETKKGYLTQLAVKKEYQKLGYGQILLDKFIEDCIAHNYTKMKLEVYSENNKAINIYTKNGFNKMEDESDSSADSFYMVKYL